MNCILAWTSSYKCDLMNEDMCNKCTPCEYQTDLSFNDYFNIKDNAE